MTQLRVGETYTPSEEGVGRADFRGLAIHARRHEASEAAKFAEASAEAAETANQHTDTGEALRHAIERVEARTAEATEFRIRLELTEQAQSTLQEGLIEERRRREEAEREREELRRELFAIREPRPSPEPLEEQQGRGQPHSDAPGPQESVQRTQGGILRGLRRRLLGQ
jgi:hypothetical protein